MARDGRGRFVSVGGGGGLISVRASGPLLSLSSEDARRIVREEMVRGVMGGQTILEHEVVSRLPGPGPRRFGVATGATVASIQRQELTFEGDAVSGRVGSSRPSAKFVEDGRGPGGISESGIIAIGQWARAKFGALPLKRKSSLGDALLQLYWIGYPIALRIMQRGFKPPYRHGIKAFANARKAAEPVIARLFEREVGPRIAQRLGGLS